MAVRAAAAVAVVAALLLAGCFGGGRKDGDADGDGAGGDGSTGDGSGGAAPGGVQARFTWTPAYPRVGAEVTFIGTLEGLDESEAESWAWEWGDGGTGSGSVARHTFAQAGERQVRLRVTLEEGAPLTHARQVLVLAAGAPDPVDPGNQTGDPVPPPGVFRCPGPAGPVDVVEPHATFGTDEAVPGLAWAALKTGFRFAVAWTSEAASVGSLTFTIGNGTPRVVSETAPTRAHLIVLDRLDVGRTLCFTVTDGAATSPLHAVLLANAMTAFQDGAPHGAYTVNTLVLVNEGGDLSEVRPGLDDYAVRLWDATDGWVRAGATLVVANDPLHHNAGWVTCYVVTLGPPACNQVYDVLFTNDAAPQGAASTYRRGVSDPEAAIWMNQYHQAMPGPVSLDDAGAVLVHEMGHYLFDMDDLYGDPVVPDSQECDVPSTSISIMGGSRDRREFDDEVNRCPGQGSGYVPSWTLMRGQFPAIPDRTTEPLDGPPGHGGLYLQRVYQGV